MKRECTLFVSRRVADPSPYMQTGPLQPCIPRRSCEPNGHRGRERTNDGRLRAFVRSYFTSSCRARCVSPAARTFRGVPALARANKAPIPVLPAERATVAQRPRASNGARPRTRTRSRRLARCVWAIFQRSNVLSLLQLTVHRLFAQCAEANGTRRERT
jgi:hypothetical protein